MKKGEKNERGSLTMTAFVTLLIFSLYGILLFGRSASAYIRQTSSIETIQKEIGSVNNMVRELTGYEMNSLALPYGIGSKEYREYLQKGSYDSVEYENKIILLVGAEPTPSPSREKLNLLSFPRVRARGGNKEVVCDLYYWLEKMEENPSMKYVRLSK